MADEFDLKPTSRAEEFLDVILRSLGGDTPDIPQPAWRYEEYLAAIANAIQNGGGGSSGGGVLYVTKSQDNTTLDKNFEEIQTALDGGKVVMLKRGSPSDGEVVYDLLIKTDYFPEDPQYYGVHFYNFYMKQEAVYSNGTSPTDPLVYEEE